MKWPILSHKYLHLKYTDTRAYLRERGGSEPEVLLLLLSEKSDEKQSEKNGSEQEQPQVED